MQVFGQALIEIDLLAVHLEHVGLFLGRRIIGHDLEHEAIQLRLGQVVRPFAFDRILRGHHQERPIELVAGAFDRDAIFLHDFQQGGVVLAGARLISSASRNCVNTGPG